MKNNRGGVLIYKPLCKQKIDGKPIQITKLHTVARSLKTHSNAHGGKGLRRLQRSTFEHEKNLWIIEE
jgi:hypothetical protein